MELKIYVKKLKGAEMNADMVIFILLKLIELVMN